MCNLVVEFTYCASRAWWGRWCIIQVVLPVYFHCELPLFDWFRVWILSRVCPEVQCMHVLRAIANTQPVTWSGEGGGNGVGVEEREGGGGVKKSGVEEWRWCDLCGKISGLPRAIYSTHSCCCCNISLTISHSTWLLVFSVQILPLHLQQFLSFLQCDR